MLFLAFSPVFLPVLAAQTQGETGFMPYVSRIKAEARNNLIRITWVDSQDARGPVYIFRSTRPFSDSVPPNIRPVEVRYGEQSYIDDTDDLVNLYYFIAASDISKKRYDLIVPQLNTINVNLNESNIFENPYVAMPSYSVESETPFSSSQSTVMPSDISELKAVLNGERVVITYDIADRRKNVIIYRSMQPIRQPQDLLNAVIVQSGVTSAFSDTPVPGISWYYAVIYEEEIISGNVSITPGANATVSSVMVAGDESIERSLRPMPLPYMTPQSASLDNLFTADVLQPTPLDKRTSELLSEMQLPSKDPLTLKTPRVFRIDMQPPSTGEASALFYIIKSSFEKYEWEEARGSLVNFLALPRSRNVEVRARFYLAQALYFTENYKEALLEFLFVKSLYPEEADTWIAAVLEAMVH